MNAAAIARLGRIALAWIVIASGFVMFSAAPAYACSCVQIDAVEIERADAAVVGEIIDGGPTASGSFWTIAVEVDVKNNLRDPIALSVRGSNDADCGVNWQVGQIVAVVAYGDESGLESSLCGQTNPETLEEYAAANPVDVEAAVLLGDPGAPPTLATPGLEPPDPEATATPGFPPDGPDEPAVPAPTPSPDEVAAPPLVTDDRESSDLWMFIVGGALGVLGLIGLGYLWRTGNS